jgi:hypothetical protein
MDGDVLGRCRHRRDESIHGAERGRSNVFGGGRAGRPSQQLHVAGALDGTVIVVKRSWVALLHALYFSVSLPPFVLVNAHQQN